jgi:carbonic anhydrase
MNAYARRKENNMIDEILAYNKKFVEEKAYEKYVASKYPNKKIAILTCMDTRLVELLPAALGLKNGDVKIIKNAGGVVTNPFGSVIRSLLVAIIELGVEEIMVIGHTDCGVQHIDSEMMIHHMKERGISQDSIDLMKYCGINFEKWLAGFDTVEQSVEETVETIRKHPLIPADVRIGGYVINTETGELRGTC